MWINRSQTVQEQALGRGNFWLNDKFSERRGGSLCWLTLHSGHIGESGWRTEFCLSFKTLSSSRIFYWLNLNQPLTNCSWTCLQIPVLVCFSWVYETVAAHKTFTPLASIAMLLPSVLVPTLIGLLVLWISPRLSCNQWGFTDAHKCLEPNISTPAWNKTGQEKCSCIY